jgi:hypothetical protein
MPSSSFTSLVTSAAGAPTTPSAAPYDVTLNHNNSVFMIASYEKYKKNNIFINLFSIFITYIFIKWRIS